jgi:hypothetical protein
VDRWLCDAEVCTVQRQVDGTLNYGRTVRTAPPKLYGLLVLRDQHCRFAGCRRPARYCEAHHVNWWDGGGETRQENLALLCVYHHHKLHQPGWHAKLKPDGELHITNPDGHVQRTQPPGLAALGLLN